MKRILLLAAVATALLAAPVAAQVAPVRVNPDALKKAIEKADADIQDAKKNTKAATWLNRGKAYAEAGAAPNKGLYKDLPETDLVAAHGKETQRVQKTVGSNTYDARVYPNFTAYMNGVLVAFWEPQLVVADNALETAYESYAKAYELDPKSASKVKEGIESIANEFRKNADNFFALQNYAKTGYSFEKSYDVLLHPAVNSIDTVSLYYAGMFYTFANEFDKGAELLEKALGYGYEADGDTYYYLYFCYVGREQNEKAKDILTEGIKKYPGNTRIVEGLVGIYSVVEGSDPSDIIPLVMESVEKEPDNALLWSGLGGIYLKLKDFPQAISAYQKALDIAPDDFYNQFRRGYTAIEYGDAMNQELNSITSTTEYNKALEEVNAMYASGLPYLEKAHELDPKNAATVELLKNLSFRLRDYDGMQTKYEKYNELFKSMSAE